MDNPVALVLRFQLALLVLYALQGCGSITARVSENYIPMIAEMPFRATAPIAQHVKFVHASGNIVTGLGGNTNVLIATNITDAREVRDHGMSYVRARYPGIEDRHFIDTSELLQSMRAADTNLAATGRAAEAKASAGQDLTLNEAAAVQTRGLAQSIDSSLGIVNASFATLDALGNWAKSEHEKDAYSLVDWIKRNTGAIGRAAPAGSTLYLDFIRVFQAQSFQLSSKSDLIVTATLEREGKTPLRSTKGIRFAVSSGSTTAEDIRGTVVYKDAVAPLVAQARLQPMKQVIHGMDLVTLASAAIADICRQLAPACGSAP